MRHLADLEIFDNSAEATPGEDLPHPTRILEMKCGLVLYPPPGDVKALKAMPHWAQRRFVSMKSVAPGQGAAARSAHRGKLKRP